MTEPSEAEGSTGVPPEPTDAAEAAPSLPRMKARRTYSRHGLRALMARVKVRGLGAIDRRTAAGRALVAWRAELLADLGGEAAVSAQRRALVDLVVRTKLYVDSLDAWLVSQPSLVLTRRRAVLPVLRERQQLADSLARLLGQLGLDRREPPSKSIEELLAEAEDQPQAEEVRHAPPPAA